MSTDRKTTKTKQQKWEEKQLYDISRDKMAILYTRKHGHGCEREIS